LAMMVQDVAEAEPVLLLRVWHRTAQCFFFAICIRCGEWFLKRKRC